MFDFPKVHFVTPCHRSGAVECSCGHEFLSAADTYWYGVTGEKLQSPRCRECHERVVRNATRIVKVNPGRNEYKTPVNERKDRRVLKLRKELRSPGENWLIENTKWTEELDKYMQRLDRECS